MAERSEAVSRTTFGGCTLDDLHRGSKNYVCDASCLVNLVGKDSNKAKEELKQKLDELFQDLELQTERRVKKYYIGKTFIKRRRKSKKTFVKFDPMDPYTWKKNGISSRWVCHKKMEYGRDGLVVLAAVPKDAVPQQCRDEVHQEQYALALEQMLLHHYKLDIGDQRLHNDTFTSGAPDGGKKIAYAVYVTFTLEEQIEEDDENDPMSSETDQPFEEQTTSCVLSSHLDIQAQKTPLYVSVIKNSSSLSVLNKQIDEHISLCDNDALAADSVNSPPSQIKLQSILGSVCNQVLLQNLSHYSIANTVSRDTPQLYASSLGERLARRLDEIDETQQNILSTNCFLYCPSPVKFEQIMMEESIGDELVLYEIDIIQRNNLLMENLIIPSMEQIPETLSHSSSPPQLPPRIPAMRELETLNQSNHPVIVII